MNNLYVVLSLFVFFAIIANSQSFAEEEGVIKIKIETPSGEPADYHGMTLQIYQDGSTVPKTIDIPSNPYDLHLSAGHSYAIELYAGGMFAEVYFVDAGFGDKNLVFSVPPPGSIRFDVVWSDGYTPLVGASVSVRSEDGKYRYWTNSTTDQTGSTIRYWLQPTIAKKEYYVAEVSLGNGMMYTSSPIIINPGKPDDLKIVTPWPKVIDQLITVSVYKSDTEKLSGLRANFTVDMYDNEETKIASSKVSDRGDAYFSNIKVGKYQLRLINHDRNDAQWGSLDVILAGKTDPLQIFTDPYESANKTQTSDAYAQVSATNSTEISAGLNMTQKKPIPVWIKNVAGWWANDSISDDEFLKAIEYLVKDGILSDHNLD